MKQFLATSKGSMARWLIVALLFAVQLHICQDEFVLPNGQFCRTCPTISEDSDSHEEKFIQAEQHGDCHDCCQLRACEDSGKNKAKAVSAPALAFDFALVQIPTFSVPEIQSESRPRLVLVEGCPPTGPPSSVSSRGPPASST